MSFRNNDDFDASSYVKVNTRLQEFWAKYPEGRVETHWSTYDNKLTVQAKLFRKQEDVSAASTAHAFLEDLTGEKVGEYTETVAVGRALALMGFSVEKSIASSEEMTKWHETQQAKKQAAESKPAAPRQSKIRPASQLAQEKAPEQTPPAAQSAPEQKTEQKADPAPAAAPTVTKEQEAAKAVTEAPKTLKASRIFKPLSKNTGATQGVSNG